MLFRNLFHSTVYSEYYINIIIFHSCTVFHCKDYHNLLNQCSIVRYLGYLNLFTIRTALDFIGHASLLPLLSNKIRSKE